MGTYFAVIDADRCAWGYFPETIVRVVVRELPLEPAPPQEAWRRHSKAPSRAPDSN